MALAVSRFSRLLPLIVASAVPVLAQGVSAQLSGSVLTKDGAPLAAASVVIRNTETGFSRVMHTDAKGRYLASLLPVGPYSVTVTKEGYQTASGLKVNLNLGDAAPMNIRLAPISGAVVEVMATEAKVDSERASTAALISTETLANVPVFNRSFTNLATLAPQVVVDSQRGNLAIAGQRGVNTSINIDGGDNNEPFFGGATGAAEGKTPFTISMEAIREYQVVTDGASAEFGRMGGGYVNAITKNGTNDLSGSLFYYKRPQSMVARKANVSGKSGFTDVGDFSHEQFGFSVGGPILKDKLFYFVAYDAQRMDTPYNMTWGGNAPVTLNPTTYANDAVLLAKGGSYSSKADSDAIFARFDWNINLDHTIQFRINHSKFSGDTGAGISAAKENLASDDITTDSYVLQWVWAINANWINEARINYTKDDMPREPYSTTPEVSITNVGYYGAYPFDRTYSTKRTQIQENLTYVTPTLQIKGGIDYNKIDVSEFFAGNWRGIYYFDSLDDFRNGLWSKYRQNFGLNSSIRDAGQFDASEKQMAAFIQADWRVTDSLKLGLGVRWDRQENPDYAILDMSNPLAASLPLTSKIPTDSQFSPRFSATWTPSFDHGQTVVRFNAGRYVSTTPSVFFYQVYANNARRTGSKDFKSSEAATYSIPRGAAFNAANPYWISNFSATSGSVDVFSFDKNFKNPYTDRANLAVERSFRDLVLGASATYAKGNQLERTADLNIGAVTGVNAYNRIQYAGRPNANYLRIMQYMSDATSLYHAYTFSAKYHKDGSNFDGQIFYTYAINKDTDSNERNYAGYSVQDAGKPGSEWGYADSDRRHVVTGYMSYREARWTGIVASLSLRYQSGTPYTVTYSKDMNNDGSNNDRLFLNGVDTGRNTFRTCSNTTMDLGLRREFKFMRRFGFTLSADVFNVLNHHDINDRLTLSSDKKSTDASPILSWTRSDFTDARRVQLGAKLTF